MTLTLSTSDLVQLEATMTTLLSPLRFEQVGAWREASRTQVETLLGAHHSAGILPCPGEPLADSAPDLSPAMDEYVSYYHALDTGLQQRRRELGLEVAHWSDVYDMHALKKTEIYNDFSRRRGLLDGIGMTYDFAEPPALAALLFYHERESSKPFGERGLALLRLLLPAFKSGVETCLRLSSQRVQLGCLFDQIPGALGAFDASGQLEQQNRAMTQLLGDASEPRCLVEELTRVAKAVSKPLHARARHGATEALVPAWSEIRTAGGAYRVHGTLVPAGLLARRALVLVTLERLEPTQRSDNELRARFNLTPREIQIARLLGQRYRAGDIARELGVSSHTVRHHTERVLMKLGVHSRAAVGTALNSPV